MALFFATTTVAIRSNATKISEKYIFQERYVQNVDYKYVESVSVCNHQPVRTLTLNCQTKFKISKSSQRVMKDALKKKQKCPTPRCNWAIRQS